MEEKDFAAPRGQRIQHGVNTGPKVRRVHGNVPQIALDDIRIVGVGGVRGTRMRMLAPHEVQRPMPRCAVQVPAQISRGIETFPTAPQLEQHLLRDIPCRIARTGYHLRHADDRIAVPTDTGIERRFIPGAEPLDELDFFRGDTGCIWRVLSRPTGRGIVCITPLTWITTIATTIPTPRVPRPIVGGGCKVDVEKRVRHARDPKRKNAPNVSRGA